MDLKNWNGLEGRNSLVTYLEEKYNSKTAAQITIIHGGHGQGKSYVIKQLLNKLDIGKNKLLLYKNYGDEFKRFTEHRSSKNINGLNISLGTPLFTFGLGVSYENKQTQYAKLHNMLSKLFTSDILICLDNLEEVSSDLRVFILEIIKNIEDLEEDFNIKIYVLLTGTGIENLEIKNNCLTQSETITLENYSEKDLKNYLDKEYHFKIEESKEISKIAKLCNNNLHIANFLFSRARNSSKDYFEVLNKVVEQRIQYIKEVGKTGNLDEEELGDLIYSSSLFLKKFSVQTLTKIINKSSAFVTDGLNIARNEALIEQYIDKNYDFLSSDIKQIIADETIKKRSDWLLEFYKYYSYHEQSDYFQRAYYLSKYQGRLTSASFSLMILAFATAWDISDKTLCEKIERYLIDLNSSLIFVERFYRIKEFYMAISINEPIELINRKFKIAKDDSLDLPVKAELTRAYFHSLYVNTSVITVELKNSLDQCQTYALEALVIDIEDVDCGKLFDETVLRLRIIYDIAPCVLDHFNNYEAFDKLYKKSEDLVKCDDTDILEKGIGKYIQNVFNRKAFLYINQTQCVYYYDKAKKYFHDLEIWDEYCITLVCEAGTDIVIQEYNNAIYNCNKVIELCTEQKIILPQIAKLHNNRIIAEFLKCEQENDNINKRKTIACKAIRELKENLEGKSTTAEFVIITNICSLYLYCDNDRLYQLYKKKIEKLYKCLDISDTEDENIDDFYRYYFAWFEVYRMIRDENWVKAQERADQLKEFIPALFRKQEVFWSKKCEALQILISNKESISAYDFCNNLVNTKRHEQTLSKFFYRGLMLSDLQYTSYF